MQEDALVSEEKGKDTASDFGRQVGRPGIGSTAYNTPPILLGLTDNTASNQEE